MSNSENLIKVGDAVLTPDAIKFIEALQYEDNVAAHELSKQLSELIAGTLILLNIGEVSDSVEKRLYQNCADLAELSFDIERLAKP
jgi:hypothetical protein